MNSKAKKVALMGILSGLAFITMLIEIPFPLAPWLKFDLSETIVVYAMLIGGPMVGIVVSGGKSVLHFILSGSNSGGVGQLAAFIAACAFSLPVYYIYKKNKNIVMGLIASCISLSVVMILLNWVFLTGYYAKLFNIVPILNLIEKGGMDYFMFIGKTYGAFNLTKAVLVSSLYLVIHKYLKRTYIV